MTESMHSVAMTQSMLVEENDLAYGGNGNDASNGQDGNDTLFGEPESTRFTAATAWTP